MINQQVNKRFALIDAMRGIAALWVVLMHFQTLILERTSNQFPPLIDNVLKYGHIGVNIFFVLSGFVIAYSIRNQIYTFAFIKNFFIRRSIRLDPPYWLTLLILTLLIYLGPLFFNKGHEYLPTFSEVGLNAFYLQNLVGIKNILPVAWTLCLEFQFYLVLVFILKIIQYMNTGTNRSIYEPFSLFGLSLLFSCFVISLLQAIQLLPSIPGLFLPLWYSFFIGCMLSWIQTKMASDYHIFVAFILMGAFSFFDPGYDIATTLVIAIALYLCIKQGHLYSFSQSSLFQFFGKVSYSLYLIHWPIGIKLISLLSYTFGQNLDRISPLALLLFSAGICVTFSEVFYRCVELPFINLSRNVSLSLLSKKLGILKS